MSSTRSWQSNLLFLSLVFTFLVLGGAGVGAAAAELNDDSPAQTKTKSSEGILGTVKHLYNVAVKGPDPTLLYEKDATDGIERLTDDNYVDKVEHPLDVGGERKDEVWVVLVHGKAGDAASEMLLEYHKQASDLVKNDPEMGNVRFARLDYVSAWKTCTRWLLNRPPYLIIITSQGRHLRFIPTQSLGKEPSSLYSVIREKMYEVILPWNGRWSPGGDRSYIIEHYITLQETISKYTHNIPNWVILAFTGIVTQQLMSWLHSSPTPPTAQPRQVRRVERVVIKEDKRA
ncbi:hypothetical protein I302_103654 [Kwoniella bestiolae CBS 10118]|uniref:Endoplasmic reticulum protein n=1 Tax=Kwoniella bestiolae CBS 10118 TaxID=1296100 RepID=A0A1B9G929_9TREE|nr:hypothetical protein I302_02359 [Kwoniella bestiolae CBS 10118]OCF27517.1 hypothetical protein I302_02359 [Kwoniella bestiolae CBS 10118]